MMAGSSGSRFLWAGLLTPPILVLASAGALMIWPQQIVTLMDAASRWGKPAPPRRTYRPPDTANITPNTVPQPAPPMIRGTIQTPDGSPFQGRYWLQTHVSGRRGFAFSSIIPMTSQTGPDFEARVQGMRTWVVVEPIEFAPEVVGPIEIKPGQDEVPPVVVKLEEGFPHRVRVVDAEGTPVAGARVHASLTLDHGPASLRTIRATDEDGWAVFPHFKEADYEFTVTVYNFAIPDDTIFVRPKPGVETTITLDRGATRGSVVDEDDRPAADALILIAAEIDEANQRDDLHHNERIVAARSDAEGRFVLPYLHKDSAYLIQAEGPDGSLGFAPGVRLEDSDFKITLRPRRTVRVQVEGGRGAGVYAAVERSIPTGFETRGPQGAAEVVKRWTTGVRVDSQGRFDYPAWGSLDSELKVVGQTVPIPWPPPSEPIRVQAPHVEPPAERRVRIQVSADPSIRPVNGTMTLRLRNGPPERSRQQVSRQVEIRDGAGSFVCLENEAFEFDRSAIPGYWTAPGSFNGGIGVGARKFDVRVYAAGEIRGRVVDTDGNPVGEGAGINAEYEPSWAVAVQATPPLTEVSSMDPPPHLARAFSHTTPNVPRSFESRSTGAAGEFELRPWPLGVPCRIVVRQGHIRRILDPVTIDAREPRRDVEIRLPKRARMEVRIVDGEGKPLAGAQGIVSMPASAPAPPWGPWFQSVEWPPAVSDADGRIVLDDLAADETEYTLNVNFPKDYQPISRRLELDGRPLELRAERGQVLEGRLVEGVTGWPIPRVQLLAWQGSTVTQPEAPTDDEGRFRFSALREGVVRLDDGNHLSRWPFPTQGWPDFEAGKTPPIVLRARGLPDTVPEPRRPEGP